MAANRRLRRRVAATAARRASRRASATPSRRDVDDRCRPLTAVRDPAPGVRECSSTRRSRAARRCQVRVPPVRATAIAQRHRSRTARRRRPGRGRARARPHDGGVPPARSPASITARLECHPAAPSARSTPRALARDSSSSRCGNRIRHDPGARTRSAASRLPGVHFEFGAADQDVEVHARRRGSASPARRCRRRGPAPSSSAMICMQRTFGQPRTIMPPGNTARITCRASHPRAPRGWRRSGAAR